MSISGSKLGLPRSPRPLRSSKPKLKFKSRKPLQIPYIFDTFKNNYLPGGRDRSLESDIGVKVAAELEVVVGGLGRIGVEVIELECILGLPLGRSSSGLLLRCTAAFKAERGEGKPKLHKCKQNCTL